MALGRVTALISACMLMLTACSFNPFSSNNHMTGNAAGAAIGATAGAGTMALAHAPTSAILLGGLGGGALGYYVTTLDFASGGLKQVGGQVYVQGDYVTIVIPTDNVFDSNSAELLPQATPVLNSVVAILNHYPNRNILISGNTSGFGTPKFQHHLSQARARQVATFLWANGINNFKGDTIETRDLTYVGYGNSFPIANDIRADSLRQNSRIQITAYPSKADLECNKKHNSTCGNIGAMDESMSSPYKGVSSSDTNIGGTTLKETGASDSRGTYTENVRTTSDYRESA